MDNLLSVVKSHGVLLSVEKRTLLSQALVSNCAQVSDDSGRDIDAQENVCDRLLATLRLAMPARHRTVATFSSGNAIGIIEEPVLRRGAPRKRRGELWKVKIGVIDEAQASSQPYPAEDFNSVVRQLEEFLANEGLK